VQGAASIRLIMNLGFARLLRSGTAFHSFGGKPANPIADGYNTLNCLAGSGKEFKQ